MAGKAGTLNLTINQHATFEMWLTWRTKGDPPQPIDNTGFRAIMQFRTQHDAPQIFFEATDQNGMITLQGVNGNIYVKIPAEKTSEMRAIKGVNDLLMRSPTGTIRRVVEGEFLVRPGVSKLV